jgi:hypothetical protein
MQFGITGMKDGPSLSGVQRPDLSAEELEREVGDSEEWDEASHENSACTEGPGILQGRDGKA